MIQHEFIAIDEGHASLLHVDERDQSRNWLVPIGQPAERDMQLIGSGKILIGHHHGYAEFDLALGRVVKGFKLLEGVTAVRRFSAQRFDKNSGMYGYLYRWFDPVQHRWLNQDPLGEMFNINMQRFVYNSPLNWVDVNGLWPSGVYGSENYHGASISRVLGGGLSKEELAACRP